MRVLITFITMIVIALCGYFNDIKCVDAKIETEPETTICIETETEIETTTEPETTTETESEWVSLGVFRLTAYCPCEQCCGAWADGITATGTLATQGRTIAVDPKVIPYGTTVMINGHEYIAEDCGGAIKQQCIDVFFDSHQEALVFGVQEAEVLIKKGE